MQGESHEKLPEIGFSRGKKIVRYNYQFVDATDNQPAKWIFEQVAVDPAAGRDEIIDALIAQTYSKSQELAAINNKIAEIKDPSLTKYAQEYVAYTAKRVEAKSVADSVLSVVEKEPVLGKKQLP
jgi:S-methylmethionine-dependent homocysteine/selenocysteine methylase